MNTTSREAFTERIAACPSLGSLRSVSDALAELSGRSESPVGKIAEVIVRDPSLATRVLRVVNSIYSGVAFRVSDIEEAVFLLGLRQIRQLSVATRIIEETESLQRGFPQVEWHCLWRHSIAVAVLSRELLSITSEFIDDTDYLVGLLHHIGKLVMAQAFPHEFAASLELEASDPSDFYRLEREAFGWTHADLGARYLERHNLSESIVEAVRHHHTPEETPGNPALAAAVQVADSLARHSGIDCGTERHNPVSKGDWTALPGWKILLGAGDDSPHRIERSIDECVENLPTILRGLI